MKLIDKARQPETNELKELLTVRTYKLLLAMGITTIEQLANADDIELLKYPTFGKRCLTECQDLIDRLYSEGVLK